MPNKHILKSIQGDIIAKLKWELMTARKQAKKWENKYYFAIKRRKA